MQSSLPGIISFLFSISGSSTDTCDTQKEAAPSGPAPNFQPLHHLNLLNNPSLLHPLNHLHPLQTFTFFATSTFSSPSTFPKRLQLFDLLTTSSTFYTTLTDSTFFLGPLGTHHVQGRVVDVLQEDPVALGHSLRQAPWLPHKLPGNVGAAVHPQQHL